MIIPKDRTVTTKRYIETFKKHFILFYKKIKTEYSCQVVIQEDNTRWRKAKIVRTFLATYVVNILS